MCRFKYHNITNHAGKKSVVVIYFAEEEIVEVILNLFEFIVIINAGKNEIVAVLGNVKNNVLLCLVVTGGNERIIKLVVNSCACKKLEVLIFTGLLVRKSKYGSLVNFLGINVLFVFANCFFLLFIILLLFYNIIRPLSRAFK